ncbi:MAG: hypothetical protein ACTSRS_01290 [Candidatus Helarchaeota archaeon]
MAARAIVGIALGMLFAPVLYIFLTSLQPGVLYATVDTTFTDWFLSITSDFTGSFLSGYITAGQSMMMCDLITLFSPATGLATWLAWFGPAIMTWVVVGMWAGAIERSPGRGIGVGIGCWLGWALVSMIYLLILGAPITLALGAFLTGWFAAVIVIVVAAIFGAITKSEEF